MDHLVKNVVGVLGFVPKGEVDEEVNARTGRIKEENHELHKDTRHYRDKSGMLEHTSEVNEGTIKHMQESDQKRRDALHQHYEQRISDMQTDLDSTLQTEKGIFDKRLKVQKERLDEKHRDDLRLKTEELKGKVRDMGEEKGRLVSEHKKLQQEIQRLKESMQNLETDALHTHFHPFKNITQKMVENYVKALEKHLGKVKSNGRIDSMQKTELDKCFDENNDIYKKNMSLKKQIDDEMLDYEKLTEINYNLSRKDLSAHDQNMLSRQLQAIRSKLQARKNQDQSSLTKIGF